MATEMEVTFKITRHEDQADELSEWEAARLWAEAVTDQQTNIVHVNPGYVIKPDEIREW